MDEQRAKREETVKNSLFEKQKGGLVGFFRKQKGLVLTISTCS